MKKMILGIAAAMLSATGAQAAVSVSQSAIGTAPKAGGTTITFDEKTPAGFRVVGGVIQSENNSFGTNPTGSTNYLTTNGTNSDRVSILSMNGFREISFDWGSIDSYNTFALLDSAGDVFYKAFGSTLAPNANGVDGTRITLASSDTAIHGIRFFSATPAFEVDNVTFSAAVPEPATWAMMILGFGMVGAAMRRRSTSTSTATAAA